MAHEIPDLLYSLVAAADLSGNQYCAVTVDTTGKAVLPGAGAFISGVLQNRPKAGEHADVCGDGIVKWRAGAALTPSNLVAVDTTGRAVVAGAGDYIVGQVLEGAAAANNVATIKICASGTHP